MSEEEWRRGVQNPFEPFDVSTKVPSVENQLWVSDFLYRTCHITCQLTLLRSRILPSSYSLCTSWKELRTFWLNQGKQMIEWSGSPVFAMATWKTIWISGKVRSSSSMMQLEPTVQNTQVTLMMEKQHCLLLVDLDMSFLFTALFTWGRNFANYQQIQHCLPVLLLLVLWPMSNDS